VDRLPLRALTALLAALATACGARALPTEPRAPLAADLFPVEAGHVWSYLVDTGNGEATLAITRVLSREGARATLATNGGEPVVYEVRDGGVFIPASDVWLLRDPIALGASWPARGDRVATVIAVDEAIDTPAGRFASCATVEERGGDETRIVRTTFCPGVGPARIESVFLSRLGGAPLRVVAMLQGHAAGE
jgi:hypothetical protein